MELPQLEINKMMTNGEQLTNNVSENSQKVTLKIMKQNIENLKNILETHKNIINLDISDCDLKEIPKLPEMILILNVSNNKLTTFKNMPQNLVY